ncbi:hypothetical protein L6164_013800 [Bauhinia variegata]|uniref:Uncharacterized protein n=1 Tax=Bauhinia variegata TaxID=167791 RepID=A0ACB9NFH5_BAUVA|nr:hypothetical protein L6164_013800 [Bauhinia variegata]
MSLPTPTQLQLKEAVALGVAPSSSSPSWNSLNNSFSPLPLHKRSEQEDSDEDLFTVPDVEATASIHSAGTLPNSNSNLNQSNVADTQFQTAFPGKRRRGRNPVDKEHRRLKRLLRNRVSAQQARERKKEYLNDLESRARELQDKNSKLEERISTLTNENTMLRKILMNTRPKVDESTEPKQDLLSKN